MDDIFVPHHNHHYVEPLANKVFVSAKTYRRNFCPLFNPYRDLLPRPSLRILLGVWADLITETTIS